MKRSAPADVRRRLRAKPEAGDPLFNRSVEKAFAVLGAFSAERHALNLKELAVAARMTPSSAQRCVHTLARLGYLARDEHQRRWVLTPRTLAVGYPYLAAHGVLQLATPHLVELNQACGESVSLSEPDGAEMVFIARFPSHRRFLIHMPVGRRLPIYCTSAGRAYLSTLPRDEVRDLLERLTFERLTPNTLVDVAEITEIIDAARDLGYAWASEECYRGDLTIGAPIVGVGGRAVASVNISGPTSRWTLPDLKARLAPLLLETARAASGTIATPRRR